MISESALARSARTGLQAAIRANCEDNLENDATDVNLVGKLLKHKLLILDAHCFNLSGTGVSSAVATKCVAKARKRMTKS